MRWLLLLLTACGAPQAVPATGYTRLAGEGLGTTWVVQWSDVPGVYDTAVREAVLAALRDVDEGMSTWRDDSDLARVRAREGPVAVREDTAFVVREALALAQATGGAFDPTVQPLVELWGFHGGPRQAWPDDEELAAARARVGWQRVSVVLDGGQATVDAGGTALDLSAIAKGHAVDRVLHAVAALGATDIFVEVGGEVRAAGRSPRGGPWTVGIEAPDPGGAPQAAVVATTALANAAMATSGNYRTAYALDGRPVHHTLDPRTGLPAKERVLSATVIAPDCRTADGWATAMMVLGTAGLPLIEARPMLDAWLVLPDGRVAATAGAERRVSGVRDEVARRD